MENVTCKTCVKEAILAGENIEEYHRLTVGKIPEGILVYCNRHNKEIMSLTPETFLNEGLMLIRADTGVTMVGIHPNSKDTSPILIFSEDLPEGEDGKHVDTDHIGLAKSPTGIGIIIPSLETVKTLESMLATIRNMLVSQSKEAN